jgi:hypothetical protein
MIKKKFLRKLILLLTSFLFSFQGIFGAKGLSDLLTRENFLKFVGNNLGWMDWVVYFILLITVTIILKDIGLRNLHALNSRARTFIALVISFISVTGLMWTLVENKIFPHYFVLFAGELLVLAVCVGIIVWAFKFKTAESENTKIAIRIAGVLVASLLINSYHTMLHGFNPSFLNNFSLNNDSLLGQITALHLEIPLLAYFIAFVLLFFLLAQDNTKEGDVSTKKKKKEKDPNVESAQKLTKEFKKNLQELSEHFNEKSKLLNQLRGEFRNSGQTQNTQTQGGEN